MDKKGETTSMVSMNEWMNEWMVKEGETTSILSMNEYMNGWTRKKKSHL